MQPLTDESNELLVRVIQVSVGLTLKGGCSKTSEKYDQFDWNPKEAKSALQFQLHPGGSTELECMSLFLLRA